jgi:hypothetical protein
MDRYFGYTDLKISSGFGFITTSKRLVVEEPDPRVTPGRLVTGRPALSLFRIIQKFSFVSSVEREVGGT